VERKREEWGRDWSVGLGMGRGARSGGFIYSRAGRSRDGSGEEDGIAQTGLVSVQAAV
jgi:hypothetical protein